MNLPLISLHNKSNSHILTEMKESITNEFFKFRKIQNSLRSAFIRDNKRLKSVYRVKKEFKRIKNNSDCSIEILKNTTYIPRGIFVYPCWENFRTEESLEVKFVPRVDSFAKFAEVLSRISETLGKSFEDYPRNLEESEIIDNANFLFWMVILFLKKTNFTVKITEVIHLISEIFDKKFKYVYKSISELFKRFKKKTQSASNTSSIITFRSNYCEMCFKYYCKVHFSYTYDFKNLETFKIYKFTKEKMWSPIKVSRDEEIKGDTIRTNSEYIKRTYDYIINFELFSEPEEDNFDKESLFLKNKFKAVNHAEEKNNTKLAIKKQKSQNSLVTSSAYNTISTNFTRPPPLRQKLNFRNLNYQPCAHKGPCTKLTCPCVSTRGVCEKFCRCGKSCSHLYKGCNCSFCPGGDDSSCPCRSSSRECDPDSCNCCEGNFCQNQRAFFKLKKKTCLAKSTICDSFGLFALEDIQEDDFICEYLGEILSKDETDRRTLFNDVLGLNYLFSLNEENDIDAYSIGNEMRYANHSSFGYENSYARSLYVRGEKHIALFASRRIAKGEEIFFDYQISTFVPWLVKYNRYFSIK